MQEAFSPEDVQKRSLAVKRDLDAAARSKAAKQQLDAAAAAKKQQRLTEDHTACADAVTLVANDRLADATSVLQDLLSNRVLSALEDRKHMIAQNLFVPQVDLSEDVEEIEEAEKKKVSGKGLSGMYAPGKSTKSKSLKEEVYYVLPNGKRTSDPKESNAAWHSHYARLAKKSKV